MKTMKKVMLAALIVFVAAANTFAFSDSVKVNREKSFDLVLSQVSNSTQIVLKDKHNNKSDGYGKYTHCLYQAKGQK